VRDLATLRRGDHCLCALNPVRQVSRLVDGAFMHAGSWELLRLFHHFVVYDDVAAVDAAGVPVTREGTPTLICEYSNTPRGAHSDEKVANREIRVWHFVIENGY
jgi:hypothetical protein